MEHLLALVLIYLFVGLLIFAELIGLYHQRVSTEISSKAKFLVFNLICWPYSLYAMRRKH